MLKPLPSKNNDTNEVIQGSDSPIIECEACHTQKPLHTMINVIITVGVVGKIGQPPFQCPLEEHWACSPDCWAKVAHACIDEHMHEILRGIHA